MYLVNSFFHFFQVGTGVTNTLINARKAIDKTFAGEAENLPVLSSSAAYGVYMAVSSNLRYFTFSRTTVVQNNDQLLPSLSMEKYLRNFTLLTPSI